MKRLLIVVALLLLPAPSWAQTCPPFPERGAQIIDALVPRYPGGAPGGTDDQRRELTRAILEQLVYEFPADGWTWKSADPGRPPSKDALSVLRSGRLCAWDWQNGGTRQRAVQPGQVAEDITGQNPIPVAGVNHLSDAPAPSSGGGGSATVDLSGVLRRLDILIDALGIPAGDSDYAQAERMFAADQAQLTQANAKLDVLASRLEQHDKSPGAMSATFGNRWVQLALGAAAAYFTAQQTK
jgi:hypothetical protein